MAPKSRLEEAKVTGTMSMTGTAPQPSLSSLEEFDTDNEDGASRSCRCCSVLVACVCLVSPLSRTRLGGQGAGGER